MIDFWSNFWPKKINKKLHKYIYFNANLIFVSKISQNSIKNLDFWIFQF